MSKKIQEVEIRKYYYASIHCPFCGQRVVDMKAIDSDAEIVNPCPHTLFFADDEGIEYRSPRFNKILDLNDKSDAEVDALDINLFELTVDDAVMFASYVSAPASYGSYVGFAPLEEG